MEYPQPQDISGGPEQPFPRLPEHELSRQALIEATQAHIRAIDYMLDRIAFDQLKAGNIEAARAHYIRIGRRILKENLNIDFGDDVPPSKQQ